MRWQYLAIWTLIGVPLIPLILLCGVAADALTFGEFGPVLAITFAVWFLWAMAFCLAWTFTSAATSYQCDGSQLIAIRRGRTVQSIECSQIASIEILDPMDLRSVLLDVAPPPEWPSARVELNGPEQRVILFPEIMIWGRAASRSAERRLIEAVRSRG